MPAPRVTYTDMAEAPLTVKKPSENDRIELLSVIVCQGIVTMGSPYRNVTPIHCTNSVGETCSVKTYSRHLQAFVLVPGNVVGHVCIIKGTKIM